LAQPKPQAFLEPDEPDEPVSGVEEIVSFETLPAWQELVDKSPAHWRRIGFVSALVFGVLTFLVLRNDLVTLLVTAAILGVLVSAIVAWAVWIMNNVPSS
jgi:hypothetical protein